MKDQSIASRIVQQLYRRHVIYTSFACLIVFTASCNFLRTEEGWTTYRHDNARSGVTTVDLTTPLALRWTFQPTHAPKPAWSEPAEELERMHSDNAYHVTTAGGRVYFGSSVDNKVYALSAKTGKVQWTFFTEGPVRYAPTVWKGRIYIGSDDGHVYCLGAKDGRLIWKYRAGPSDEKVLGNGRMISLWPVRTSVLVDEGVVYFGAGVFPYEGLYICALDADDGTPIWKNDTVGDLEHEVVFGGISPQGYLIASENVLYVPSGRAMPAAFDRESGQFLYYMFPPGKVGGTWALLDESNLVAGVDLSGIPTKVTYDELTGERKDDVHAWFPGMDLVVTPDFAYTLTGDGIYAIDRAEYLNIRDRRNAMVKEGRELRSKLEDLRDKLAGADEETRNELTKQRDDITQRLSDLAAEEERLKASICTWEYPNENLGSLILAGEVVYAGGEGLVVAVDAVTGKELWTSKVEGKACGIAATSKELLISTDNGDIYCFAEGKISAAKEVRPAITLSPFREDDLSPIYESAAEAIVRETGIKSGYCLVLGAGTGRLASELAKRTELKIVGIEADREKVEAAKNRLDEAGLYGSRVVVEPWELSTLPDYFANLIVSDEMLISGEIEGSPEEMFRVLKPCGGIAYFGQPGEANSRVKSVELQNLLRWLGKSGAPEPEVAQENGIWAKVTREKLEGAGSWTHQYGNPQNTACSGDELVKGQLGVLWYGEPGPQRMVERHARAASPVSIDGRLFIQGEEVIMAYDAYNGTVLWEREIPGAVRVRVSVDGGNLAVTDDALYVAAHDKCYRLDPVTGETVRVYEIPSSPGGSPRRWGYISCTGNTLYGSTAQPMKREYAALWNDFVENGKWKNIDEIPSEYRMQYTNYINTYAEPDAKARADFQRSGALWGYHDGYMADFPEWENYNSSKGAVTENIMVSDKIFAMDAETGKLLWTHSGKRIAHVTISIGDGRIFFAESAVSEDQKKGSLEDRKELIRKGIYEEAEGMDVEYEDTDVRMAIALDAATGKRLWEKSIDLTGCGGDNLASIYHDGVLLFFGSVGNHDAWRFIEGTLKWKRIAALSAQNGNVLWSRALNYRTRPLI
ncbi:MAG: PQQ-binding-like beta-propeller repeat protein, partial [Candidatus Brocadiales bacterium]|nr:PQQ-binding-like beta-propeller repeat protein [Candidatus Bathyanammoxibius sp.]